MWYNHIIGALKNWEQESLEWSLTANGNHLPTKKLK